MFMRFRGGGVGHKSTRDATEILETQNDVPISKVDTTEDDDWDEIEMVEAPGVGNDRQSDSEDEEVEDVGVAEGEDEGESDADDQLGAEDGEGVDDEDLEGYAQL